MPFNFPVEIKCQSNKANWTEGRKIDITQRDAVLKRILIWFSTGCSGKVYIKIKRNGNLFLPKQDGFCRVTPADPTGYGPCYSGDNMTWPIHCPTVISNNDIFTVEYINNDGSNDHQVVVHFEAVLKPSNMEVDTEGTGAGRRKPFVDGEIRQYSPEMLAQEVSLSSPSADRGARAPTREEEAVDDGYERVNDPRKGR